MGVDIYGINPATKSIKPEKADFESEDKYCESLWKWERETPGVYFRANWWSWRPIVFLIDRASNLFNLGIDTQPLHYNDGKGLESQEECTKLADALEATLGMNENMQTEEDQIYLCLGSWCNSEGTFVEKEVAEVLNKRYHAGEILYTKVVMEGGLIVQPAHGVDVEYVKEFIDFLRNCGGFRIW